MTESQKQVPPQIFVSYAHADKERVQRLYEQLARAGFRPWMDERNVFPGERSPQRIADAIQNSDFFIVCLSAHSVGPTGDLKREIKSAINQWQPAGRAENCYIPVCLDPYEESAIPEELSQICRVDLFAQDGFKRLAEAIFAGMSRLGLIQPKHLFISYRRQTDPDAKLAYDMRDLLTCMGHTVFIDTSMRTGTAWLAKIDQELKESDFLIVLLSEESAESDMVRAEVQRAYEYYQAQNKPRTLPVRIAYKGMLPYEISAFLNPLQYVMWRRADDTPHVVLEIEEAVKGPFRDHKPSQDQPLAEDRKVPEGMVISDDGRIVAKDGPIAPPLPEFDPRYLVAPGGTAKLNDKFYLQRTADALLKREIIAEGSTTTIRAARQTGKSSLLVRGIQHARDNGVKVVHLDMQNITHEQLNDLDDLTYYLAQDIVRQLGMNSEGLDKRWKSPLGALDKLTYLLEEYVLPENQQGIVLAVDEADRLLDTSYCQDFFSRVRFWHNQRALYNIWNRLNVVMVISTEPYLYTPDVSQSPFNVGLKLYLEDFDDFQVRDMNHRHGDPVKEDELVGFVEMLNGHPYLTRKALYTMLTEHKTWTELAQVAATDQGPFSDHLRRQLWLLKKDDKLGQALRQIIDGQKCDDEMALFRLLRAGLVRGSGEVTQCRCGLYQTYLKDKL